MYFSKYIFLFLFLAPDGRIIVYGGTNDINTIITDKLAILDTKSSPFRWAIPKIIFIQLKQTIGDTLQIYMEII